MNRVKSYHFAPLYRGDSYLAAYTRHLHLLFSHLNLAPGARVLEIGTGDGSAALELASFSQAEVVSVGADFSQIERVKMRARQLGISDRVTFIYASSMNGIDLLKHFSSDTFDGVYAIESLQGYSSYQEVFSMISQILKKGGVFAAYEWCWTPSMDPLNEDHTSVAHLLEAETDIGHRGEISERSLECALEAMRNSQLITLHSEDMGCRRATVPWYTPLDDALQNTTARWATEDSIGPFLLTRDAAAALALAGRLKIFSPMVLLVGKCVK